MALSDSRFKKFLIGWAFTGSISKLFQIGKEVNAYDAEEKTVVNKVKKNIILLSFFII